MESELGATVDLLGTILVAINAYDPTIGLLRFWQRYQPRVGIRLDKLIEGMFYQWEFLI